MYIIYLYLILASIIFFCVPYLLNLVCSRILNINIDNNLKKLENKLGKIFNYIFFTIFIIWILSSISLTAFIIDEVFPNCVRNIKYKIALNSNETVVFNGEKFIKKVSEYPDKHILKTFEDPVIYNVKSNKYHTMFFDKDFTCDYVLYCTENCVYMELKTAKKWNASRICEHCKHLEDEHYEYLEDYFDKHPEELHND